ncbi:hypothetical protein HKBW3C_03204, partial [Candidatus Hakubella thermalkaliphila]
GGGGGGGGGGDMYLIKHLGLSEEDLPLSDGRVQRLPAGSGDPQYLAIWHS